MNKLTNTICCFTGHRDLFLQDTAAIQRLLEREIARLIRRGVRIFLAGGALGFDTLAAQAVLKLRAAHPAIRLVLVLPCRNQTAGWRDEDKQAYSVIYTAERYYTGCMHKRNRVLADNSGWCVCWQTKATGGTAYTVERCRARGVRVINLAGKIFNNLSVES